MGLSKVELHNPETFDLLFDFLFDIFPLDFLCLFESLLSA